MDTEDWKRFTMMVEGARIAAERKDLSESELTHAATFATLGTAILDIVARLGPTSDKPVDTGPKIWRPNE